MSPVSEAKIAANQANAQHSTGPRAAEGQATSAKNAIKTGLFAAKDFIGPGEEPEYGALNEALHQDLAPQGQLEHHHVNEIRRAMLGVSAAAATSSPECSKPARKSGPTTQCKTKPPPNFRRPSIAPEPNATASSIAALPNSANFRPSAKPATKPPTPTQISPT